MLRKYDCHNTHFHQRIMCAHGWWECTYAIFLVTQFPDPFALSVDPLALCTTGDWRQRCGALTDQEKKYDETSRRTVSWLTYDYDMGLGDILRHNFVQLLLLLPISIAAPSNSNSM